AGAGGSTLPAVAWSPDGTRLYAGGSHDALGRTQLRIWDEGGRGQWRDVPTAQHAIRQIMPCRDTLAISTADPSFGIVSLGGDKRVGQEGATPDMRGKEGKYPFASFQPGLAVSADASRVRFGLGYGSDDPFLFDVASGERFDLLRYFSGLSGPDIS